MIKYLDGNKGEYGKDFLNRPQEALTKSTDDKWTSLKLRTFVDQRLTKRV